MKKHLTVIADGWKKMITAGPGLGQRTGRETIVDKFWIKDDGSVVHHGMATTHQEWALRFLRDEGKFRSSGNVNRDMLRAENVLLERGYIRAQVYSHDGLGLQGKEDAIKTRGHAALQIVPKPRRIYISIWPEETTTLYLPEQIEEIWPDS